MRAHAVRQLGLVAVGTLRKARPVFSASWARRVAVRSLGVSTFRIRHISSTFYYLSTQFAIREFPGAVSLGNLQILSAPSGPPRLPSYNCRRSDSGFGRIAGKFPCNLRCRSAASARPAGSARGGHLPVPSPRPHKTRFPPRLRRSDFFLARDRRCRLVKQIEAGQIERIARPFQAAIAGRRKLHAITP
jgi:hypothetical protein